jgi:hypothetical protein
MAFNNTKAFYTSSVKYAAITAWAVATAKTVGQLVRQVSPAVNSERVFMCVVAGTTHATTEPTWNLSRGDSTTDNASITWLEVTGNSAICADITNTPNWTLGSKAQSVSRGHIIQNNAGTHLFICTTSGTGHATTEPTWNTTTGATTADNSATFTCIGATSRYGKFEGAAARIQCVWALFGNSGGTDPWLHFVGSDHAETQASSINWSSKGTQLLPIDLICIDVAGNVPPTASGDLSTAGTVTCTGSNTLTLNGIFRIVYGLTFTAGTSANIQLNINTENDIDRNFESCNFRLGSGVGSSASMQFSRSNGKNTLKDCTFKFSNTGQGIYLGGWCQFQNCSVDGAGSIPSVFLLGNNAGSMFEFNACDLSALSGSTFGNNGSQVGTNIVTFNDCKVPASFTPWAFSGSNSMSGEKVTFNRCTSSAQPIMHMSVERSGTLDAILTVYRHDGASENSVNYGWRVVQTVNTNAGSQYFQCPMIAAMNATISADVTVTVYGVLNGASLPTNIEAWLEVTYLGSASNDQGTVKSNKVANFVVAASAHSADTSDWDDGVTARANSTAYVVGDVRKVASNPGRIFICTQAGTTAGSEPGGYASAVDGGSVTDNTAIFRAAMRFKMVVTLTSPQPQQAGLIYAAIKLAKASATFYFDPLLELT